ncbi:MAG TPA: S41 family peptidase [Vicinamibacterales bacterium]|nr:S41 family peptidase [Vicinamibacterales bacterium]
MRVLSIVLVVVCAAVAGRLVQAQGGAAAPGPAPKYAFSEPGLSPDGREIAFSSGGDIWSVAAAGGEARLLVADGAFDRRPLFSPDGRDLAFVSSRTGGGDIYVLALATGSVRRVTWDDGLEQLDGWSRDSRWIYFSSTSRDISGMNDIFRVSRDGGTPMAVSADRYVNEFGAAASPDGHRLAFSAHGIGSSQWWRKAGSHLDQSELWLVDLDKAATPGPAAYTELTKRDSRQLWPMWNADGSALFYVADRGGAENIWTRPASASGADRQVTSFRDGRVLWPSITTDGRTVAFERGFGIWTVDTAGGQPREVPITRHGAAAAPAPERTRQTNQFSGLALSPDGKKVVFAARGDLFAASAKDGGDAARVTSTPELESQAVWAPDSRRIAYVSARQSGQQIYLYDFGSSTETALTAGSAEDLSPVFSPDGRAVAFLRNRKELHVLDVGSKQDRVMATGLFADTLDNPRPVWSPDGQWIALFAIGAKGFTNVELVSARGDGPPRPVSFLANTNANSIAWSRDGTFLLFDTGQRTEPGQLARVDLTLRTPKFREDLFRDLFAEPRAPGNPAGSPGNPPGTAGTPPGAPGSPVVPVFDGIRQRLSLLPLGVDVGDVTITPDGKTAIVIASSVGQSNVWAYSLDELAAERPVARQLSTTAGGKSSVQVTPDSREVYYLDAGRINIVTIDRRESRPLNVTAEFTTDFASEKLEVFQQAWTLLRDNFFDPNFNGVNWEQSREAYGERVAAASMPDEMRRIVSLMIGDLNASHLGMTGPAAPPAIGRLGLEFDRADYEASGRLRVTDVVPLGPAALTGAIHEGDALVAVDGRATGARVNLDELLANTIDRRVTLTIAPAGAAGQPTRDVVVRPTNQATEKGLRYRRWVEQNREYVLKKSGGRLGYVHMIDMSAGALDQLYVDLDTENQARDGVVVDIRNNNGGFVNAYAIDVFTRQPYLRMASRGLPEAPARTLLGQRALEAATVLVVNQHSLSDAEDFTEGYRTLKLGPVVGEPTAGWIIYTSNVRLVDGSTLRLPHTRIRAADGTDMERHPRPVDVAVTRPLGETRAGTDAQLDEAIRALLKKLGKAE